MWRRGVLRWDLGFVGGYWVGSGCRTFGAGLLDGGAYCMG